MPTFSYEAKDQHGADVFATIEANSEAAALQQLRDRGLYLTRWTAIDGVSTSQRVPVKEHIGIDGLILLWLSHLKKKLFG